MALMGRLLQQNLIHGMQILIKGAAGVFKEEFEMHNIVCFFLFFLLFLFIFSMVYIVLLIFGVIAYCSFFLFF